MEIELGPIEHSTDGQHHSGAPNMTSKSSYGQNTSDITKVWNKHDMRYHISRSRYLVFLNT